MDEIRVSEIRRRLSDIEEERRRLRDELAALKSESGGAAFPPLGTPAADKPPSTADEKVALFLKLFRCRQSVYPKRWENRKTGAAGYSPACRNDWKPGVCGKPKVKCSQCHHQDYPPLDDVAVRRHLEGHDVIGTYAIREDDTCVFLAADFDGKSWQGDAAAYRDSGRSLGVDVALERSRSGDGCHAWIFFHTPVPSNLARHLGTILMARASAARTAIGLASYDRFFPNQDTLPKGGYGNLIALPLQKRARENGNTCFLDDNLEIAGDQWAKLAGTRRLSYAELEMITASMAGPPPAGLFDEQDVVAAEKALAAGVDLDAIPALSGQIAMTLGAEITLPVADLPASVVSLLRKTATFANPAFFELQRLRFSTWKTPRYIFCGEFDGRQLRLPRGCREACTRILEDAGAEPVVIDRRTKAGRIKCSFRGALTPAQKSAVTALSKDESGVLVAPPGSGKTVIACALIAKRRAKTLILVHRKPLVEQWKARIETFLGLTKKEVGSLRSGGKGSRELIDIGLIQSLSRYDPAFLARYDHVIVDECHHVPAITFEALLKKIPCRFMLGLTATPYRKDGHHPIIHMQCGPVRHSIAEVRDDARETRKVIFSNTPFIAEMDSRAMPIHLFWEALTTDTHRNAMIATDILALLAEGRFPLILSDRKEQLQLLSADLQVRGLPQGVHEFVFVGGMGKKVRAKSMSDIRSALEKGERPFILATGSLIGEGFDLPELDSLVLAMPVSFKGKVIQYAGRIHRVVEGKTEVRILDYLDRAGLTYSMFKKRLRAYKSMGYEVQLPDDGAEPDRAPMLLLAGERGKKH